MSPEALKEEVQDDMRLMRAVLLAYRRGLSISRAAYLLGTSKLKVKNIYRCCEGIASWL